MLALLARPTSRASVTWSPLDPRWYESIGGVRSDAGIRVLPEDALKIAVVYRGINVLAHSVASIPLVIYRRLPNDGKERARSHPAYELLHDRPNTWMTSFRWRHLAMVQKILWGNHYSEILPGLGGISALKPLSPDTTRVADQLSDGRLVYVTRDVLPNNRFGPERTLLQDEVFHLRGFSFDGKSGIPLSRLARNAMGLALAAEKHGSMFLRNGARFTGLLSTEATMTDEVRKTNEKAWLRAYSGPASSGTTPLLTGGLKFQEISADNKNSQWLESRTFQVEELLRFIGVPGVLCGYADKTSTYASAEQFFLSYVKHSVQPHTEEFAQELTMSVVTGGSDYYADFILEGLLKGDIKTRYEAHQSAILAGWKSRNEVRVAEDLNRGPDELDEFLEPTNMVEAGSRDKEPAENRQRGASPDEGDSASEDADQARLTRLSAIAHRTAERLSRKEVAAVIGTPSKLGAARRYAGNPERWRSWLAEFYEEHTTILVEELGVPHDAARAYCDQRITACRNGIPAPDAFGNAGTQQLLVLMEAA